MRILAYKKIRTFSEKHPETRVPLNLWYHTVKGKEWKNLNELKEDFNSVDYIGNHRFVFSITGNNYRLVAIISFKAQKVYVPFIGTHTEYDSIKNIKTI